MLVAVLVLQLILPNYWQIAVVTIMISAVAAMGLTVLQGWAGVPSLATAALLLLGGYCAAYFSGPLGLPLIVVLILTLPVGALCGGLMSLPSRRLTGLYLILGTLAFHFIVTDGGNLLQSRTLDLAGYFLKPPSFFGLSIDTTTRWLWASAIAMVLTFEYLRYLGQTRVGRSLVVISEDRAAGAVVGVNVAKYIGCVFAISSALICASGALLGYYVTNVSYDGFSLLLAVNYIVMIVLGGLGSLPGAIAGAAIVTLIPLELEQVFSNGSGSGWIETNISYINAGLYALIGMLVLVFIPGGIADRRAWRRLAVRVRRLASAISSGPRQSASRTGREAAPASPDALVSMRGVHAAYGAGETALVDVDLDVPKSGAVVVLGRNGAGKSSLLHAIGGFPPETGGRVGRGRVEWRRGGTADITKEAIPRRVRRGIVLVPAEDKVFADLSVRAHLREAIASYRGNPMTIESVLEIFPVLRGRLEARAGTLSGGERQQVALAAAMARNTRLLLVDEASLGLSPAAILSVTDVLRAISASEVTSLVAVEQSVSAGFSVGQTIALMDGGEVVQVAPPSAEFRDLIERSYLGGTESSTVATPHAAAQAGAAGVGQTAIRLDGVTVTIGAIRAIEGVSVEVPKGEMIGIIGGNGSGKTSLLNVISGYYRPSAGQVRLAGRDIRGMPPHRIAALGVARTFQSVGHVTALRAVDWVRVGLEATWSAGVIWTVFGDPRTRHAERASLDAAMEILERAGLAAYANVRLADCPYGVRKMVDLVRVFVRDPEVVLLDEPTSGVSRSEIQRIRELVLGYQDREPATVLVVDHDVRFVTSLCARVLVMSAGKVIAFGPHEEVLADPEVVRTVLGIRAGGAPGAGPAAPMPVEPVLREGKGP